MSNHGNVNNIVCVGKIYFLQLDKIEMKGTRLSHPSPPSPQLTLCELFYVSFMSKLVNSILFNPLSMLISAYIYIYKKIWLILL